MSAPDGSRILGVGDATSAIVDEVRRRLCDRPGNVPILVALDGGSGSGKSTLGASVAVELDAVVVESDDFFATEITDAEWDALSPSERAAAVIDWRRLREEALEPLLAGRVASWHPFDFAAGTRPDGTYAMAVDAVTREPKPVIVLDGAYSSRPELADLIDLTILVDVPVEERHRRIAARDEAGFARAWHARWDAAEDHYFSRVRPASSFDMVVRMPSSGREPSEGSGATDEVRVPNTASHARPGRTRPG
jgi:para-aminobenzoate synthetase